MMSPRQFYLALAVVGASGLVAGLLMTLFGSAEQARRLRVAREETAEVGRSDEAAPQPPPSVARQEDAPREADQEYTEGLRCFIAGWYVSARSHFARAQEFGHPKAANYVGKCDRLIALQERTPPERRERWARRPSISPGQPMPTVGGDEFDSYYEEMVRAGDDPATAAWVRDRARQMQTRDDIRKWRYQHGLPTQNPTLWERLVDPEPW